MPNTFRIVVKIKAGIRKGKVINKFVRSLLVFWDWFKVDAYSTTGTLAKWGTMIFTFVIRIFVVMIVIMYM